MQGFEPPTLRQLGRWERRQFNHCSALLWSSMGTAGKKKNSCACLFVLLLLLLRCGSVAERSCAFLVATPYAWLRQGCGAGLVSIVLRRWGTESVAAVGKERNGAKHFHPHPPRVGQVLTPFALSPEKWWTKGTFFCCCCDFGAVVDGVFPSKRLWRGTALLESILVYVY